VIFLPTIASGEMRRLCAVVSRSQSESSSSAEVDAMMEGKFAAKAAARVE
jgi:hypothetical protein